MTTIAYKDGVLAADTLSTSGNSRDGYTVKIAKRGPVLAAASGSAIFARKFLDWFRAGMNGDPPAMKDGELEGTGHIFTPDGDHLTLWHYGWSHDRDEFYADGSGWQYARGAMSMGATPEQALAVAAQHDTKTGGAITVLRH